MLKRKDYNYDWEELMPESPSTRKTI